MNSTSHIGAAGELFACQYFLAQGLEVFRNVAPSGPVDLIVFNKDTGQSVAIDVKSLRSPYVRSDGTYCLKVNPQFLENDIAIVVYIHGEASVRLPDGFWEALGMETSNE